MRVGLVCPYDLGVPGGVQDQVVRLAGWLRSAGHTATIVGPGECDDPGFVSAGPATAVNANGSTAPVALSPRTSSRVIAALDGFDVIHVHEPLIPQVSLSTMRLVDKPIVGTFHADTSWIGSRVYRLGRPLTRRWFKNLDVITAVSPIAARVVAYTGRVRIIPNGIDVDDYTASGPKEPESVVFLGRNDERKGLPVLLAAWPDVVAAHQGAHLTIVGSDAESDSPIGVTFVGRVPEREKIDHLRNAAIYCAPNLSGESFGIVVAEGMAAGCAVVASGLPAFVRVAGDAARFVAPGDSSGLAREINSLLDDPGEARRLGSAAATSVRRFDGSVVAAAYIKAYEDALAVE